MKDKRETTTLYSDGKRPWAKLFGLTGVLLLVLMSMLPTAARAECVLQTTSNYTVMLEGTNKLRLKFPVYDKDGYDCWIVEGTITIKLNNTGEEATLFSVDAMEHDISEGDYNPYMKCHKGVDGTMTLYRERSYGNVSIGNTKNQYTTVPTKNNDDDTSWANLLWEIPSKYRGQSVTIKWSIHHNGNVSEPDRWLSIDDSKIDIPAEPVKQEPLLMEPVVSYSSSRPNQIMVPYMIAATKIKSLEACYTEIHGAATVNRVLDLGTDANGFLYFDAETPIKDLYIEANYTNAENKDVTSESSKMDVPVLHHAKGLGATLQSDGKVAVSWSVANPHWTDIMDSDNWEIQRNTTGSSDADDTGWTSIGQLAYSSRR